MEKKIEAWFSPSLLPRADWLERTGVLPDEQRYYVIPADAYDKEQSKCCGNCRSFHPTTNLREEYCGDSIMQGYDFHPGKDFCCKLHEWKEDDHGQ